MTKYIIRYFLLILIITLHSCKQQNGILTQRDVFVHSPVFKLSNLTDQAGNTSKIKESEKDTFKIKEGDEEIHFSFEMVKDLYKKGDTIKMILSNSDQSYYEVVAIGSIKTDYKLLVSKMKLHDGTNKITVKIIKNNRVLITDNLIIVCDIKSFKDSPVVKVVADTITQGEAKFFIFNPFASVQKNIHDTTYIKLRVRIQNYGDEPDFKISLNVVPFDTVDIYKGIKTLKGFSDEFYLPKQVETIEKDGFIFSIPPNVAEDNRFYFKVLVLDSLKNVISETRTMGVTFTK